MARNGSKHMCFACGQFLQHIPSHPLSITAFFTLIGTMAAIVESEESVSAGWADEMGAAADQLFVVSTYTDFDRLGK